MRARIEARKAIWPETNPEYHGELVDFGPMMTWTKPVQKPHPSIIVGGMFPHAARRALRYGDGWIPHMRRPEYEDVTDLYEEFRVKQDMLLGSVTVQLLRPGLVTLAASRGETVRTGRRPPPRGGLVLTVSSTARCCPNPALSD